MTTAVDFTDTSVAFADKSDAELRRANLLFTLMSYPWLVGVGSKLAQWALRTGLPVEGIIKHTIYRQFCGGESLEDARQVIRRLKGYNIHTILDYGVEAKDAEADFERTARQLVQTLDCGRGDCDMHIISTKLSALFRNALLEKATAGQPLTGEEDAEWQRGLLRVDRICGAARDAGIGLHIDAEEYAVQGAIDRIAWEMSRRYNLQAPVVINAVQLYRKDRPDFLRRSLDHAREHGYLCAVKLVRGAYMEKERRLAAEGGYLSPIHDTIEDTHRAYNAGLRFCLDHIDQLYVCNATHNEASIRLQIELMDERGIAPGHPRVVTAQLYGMSDNLSFNMAAAGYNVEKYLPYGPVREVIPYLLRRTRENTSVGGQMGRELRLIREEMRRRGIG